jgi:DNA-binding winged helix-turn-helix (wHTH) protein
LLSSGTTLWSGARSASAGSDLTSRGASCGAIKDRCGSAAGRSTSSAYSPQLGGKVVSKDELMARVWAGVVVEEHNIQVHISALRRAFEEDGDSESWIVTVPGQGYRFLGSLGPPAAEKSAPASSSPVAEEPSLAVLPFQNLSGDPEQEYFADGMVEEIITPSPTSAGCRLSPAIRALPTRARTST